MAPIDHFRQARRSYFVPVCATWLAVLACLGSPGCLNPMPDEQPSVDFFEPAEPDGLPVFGEGVETPSSEPGNEGPASSPPPAESQGQTPAAPAEEEEEPGLDSGADAGPPPHRDAGAALEEENGARGSIP